MSSWMSSEGTFSVSGRSAAARSMAPVSRSWLTTSRTLPSSSLASACERLTWSSAWPSPGGRPLQVQGQRGQLVAEQVMQLARNAGALVDPRTLGQQGPGGAQLRIEPALLVAGLGLLSRDQAGHEDEHGKAAIQQRLHHCFEQREAQQHVVDRRDRQLADQQPQHSQPHRQHPRDDPGGHHHQDAAQARAAEEADPSAEIVSSSSRPRSSQLVWLSLRRMRVSQ